MKWRRRRRVGKRERFNSFLFRQRFRPSIEYNLLHYFFFSTVVTLRGNNLLHYCDVAVVKGHGDMSSIIYCNINYDAIVITLHLTIVKLAKTASATMINNSLSLLPELSLDPYCHYVRTSVGRPCGTIVQRDNHLPLTPPPSSTLPSPTTSPALNPFLNLISVWGRR